MSPVRPRRQKVAPGAQWTPEIALALSIGPRPGAVHPTDSELAAAWALFAPAVLRHADPERPPWAWWRFDPSVPAELRGDRRELHPVGADADAEQAARQDLEDRRRLWLDTRRHGAPT